MAGPWASNHMHTDLHVPATFFQLGFNGYEHVYTSSFRDMPRTIKWQDIAHASPKSKCQPFNSTLPPVGLRTNIAKEEPGVMTRETRGRS